MFGVCRASQTDAGHNQGPMEQPREAKTSSIPYASILQAVREEICGPDATDGAEAQDARFDSVPAPGKAHRAHVWILPTCTVGSARTAYPLHRDSVKGTLLLEAAGAAEPRAPAAAADKARPGTRLFARAVQASAGGRSHRQRGSGHGTARTQARLESAFSGTTPRPRSQRQRPSRRRGSGHRGSQPDFAAGAATRTAAGQQQPTPLQQKHSSRTAARAAVEPLAPARQNSSPATWHRNGAPLHFAGAVRPFVAPGPGQVSALLGK